MDELRLRQILLNLMGNAIKFTEKGFVNVKFSAIEKNVPDSIVFDIRIEVSDTGIGIADESLEMIFESFQQQSQHDSRKYEGTGLGLSITRRLVEIMNGIISVQSTIRKGSSFTVLFPSVPCKKSTDNILPEDIDLRKIAFNKIKLLIADDSKEIRGVIKGLLFHSEITLLEADNGADAVNIAVNEQPDIIIMDIKMPKLNGFDAAEKIRLDDKSKQIPIIAFTGSYIDKLDIQPTPFNSYLIKPVRINDLVKELMKYLPHYNSKRNSVLSNLLNNEKTISETSVEIMDFIQNYIKPQLLKFKKKQPIKRG
ncbi:MAG: response regulator [Bacteroidales bacterium]|nr:response regulator [Bacteroidales bacterium]